MTLNDIAGFYQWFLINGLYLGSLSVHILVKKQISVTKLSSLHCNETQSYKTYISVNFISSSLKATDDYNLIFLTGYPWCSRKRLFFTCRFCLCLGWVIYRWLIFQAQVGWCCWRHMFVFESTAEREHSQMASDSGQVRVGSQERGSELQCVHNGAQTLGPSSTANPRPF